MLKLLLFCSFFLVSCAQEESINNRMIVTNFSVTASGQDTVAKNSLQQTLSWFIPTAVALTPPFIEDANGVTVNLTTAWIVLKKIQFKTSDSSSEQNDQSYHYKGPFFIDLLSSDPVQFGEIELAESGLRRVKMLLHKDMNVPAFVPQELQGKSIYLKGTINGHEFTYLADDTTDFDISTPNAVVPEEGKDLLVSIRLAHMFRKINLSSIQTGSVINAQSRHETVNPCPEIHPSSRDLYTCFRMGLAQEARFGKDNGNKELE